MKEPQEREREILADIEHRTGLAFRLLGGIDTRDRAVSRAVLPVLVPWAERLRGETNARQAVYGLFHTKYASPWLKELLLWWQDEPAGLPQQSLTQTIALLVACAHAREIWSAYQHHRPAAFRYLLLSKLAPCPEVHAEVMEELLAALERETLTIGDLNDISKVDHPKVRDWFKQQENAADPRVAALAKKVLGTACLSIPDIVERMPDGPTGHGELFSTECDLPQFDAIMKDAGKRFGIAIPTPLRRAKFLAVLDLDSWYRVRLSTQGGDPASLWLRLEDVDTVELVVTAETGQG